MLFRIAGLKDDADEYNEDEKAETSEQQAKYSGEVYYGGSDDDGEEEDDNEEDNDNEQDEDEDGNNQVDTETESGGEVYCGGGDDDGDEEDDDDEQDEDEEGNSQVNTKRESEGEASKRSENTKQRVHGRDQDYTEEEAEKSGTEVSVFDNPYYFRDECDKLDMGHLMQEDVHSNSRDAPGFEKYADGDDKLEKL